MDLGMKGRAAAVAAASKGLGRACALAIAAEGADVAICARGEDALRATEKEIGALGVRAHAVALDLAEPGACERFVEEAASAFGRLDVLVANNGGPPPVRMDAATDEQLRDALEGNLMVTVRLVRAALPHMRANGWGRIVAITSTTVKQPLDGLGLSNTARAGVTGFLKTLANEVAPESITVNAVAPGPFLTDRIRALAGPGAEDAVRAITGPVPVQRVGDPAELGALVAFLASERAGFITGQTVVSDGGVVRAAF